MQRSNHVITRLGHHGDGIAEGPLFVPRALPGEVVSGIVDGQRLTELRIEEPVAERVRAPCRHYASCGGCQVQHASDDFVATWKQDQLRTALAAQGLETEQRPVATSPAGTRRRAALSVRRTKKGALIGFHARASDVIVETPDCLLLDPQLSAQRPALADLAQAGASRKGALSALVTVSAGGVDVHVSGGKPLDGPLRIALAEIAARYDLARLSWEDETVVTRRAPAQRFGRAEVVPPPGAFLQATPEGEAALVAGVREIVGGAARVADLFSGCGTFALPLSEKAEVFAVEGAAPMVEALDRGWRHAGGLRRVTAEARDLFRRPVEAAQLAKLDAVVLDPARAGAEAQVAEIAASGVARVAYVSCNPVTFARDARQLVDAGYRLSWAQVVDQFRWSAHIELIGAFERG